MSAGEGEKGRSAEGERGGRSNDGMQRALKAALGPAFKAYAIGYGMTVIPLVLKILLAHLGKRGRRRDEATATTTATATATRLVRTVVEKLGDRFALATAIAIGGWKTLDQGVVYPRLARWRMARGRGVKGGHVQTQDERLGDAAATRQTRALSTFLSASFASYLAMSYLHGSRRVVGTERSNVGKTVEITLFFFVRALDALLRFVYATSPLIQRTVPLWLVPHGDTLIFTLSCFEIMFSWFYSPSSLPKAYVGWITKLARMDERLLQALRLARAKTWRYRVDDGNGRVLGDMAEEMGLPFRLGDPAQMDRLTCTIVHCGLGESCELNAAKRWAKAFQDCLKIYLPVHLLPPLLFRPRHFLSTPRAMGRALLGAGRSSAFLATFIASIWAAICLARTRLGPRLLPGRGQIYWDDTHAVALGCMLCGLSVSIENPRRRGEMALYVAPRALFSLFQRLGPRRLMKSADPTMALLERLLFASSFGLLLAAQRERPDVVRGITKGVLGWVIKEEGGSGNGDGNGNGAKKL